MKHVIRTGTDGAALCCFDAEALPDDFDKMSMDDPVGTFERLQVEQRAWYRETGGDGKFLFHVHVDEPIPPNLEGVATGIADFDAFHCPSGKLWICGAEYAARDPGRGSEATPRGGLDRFSQMGGCVPSEKGSRRMNIYACEANGIAGKQTDGSGAPRPYRLLMYGCAVVGIIAALAGIVSLIVGLIGKGVQALRNSPEADTGWQVFPYLLLVAVGGAALVGFSFYLDSRMRRAAKGKPGEDGSPDYLIEIR